MPITTDLSPRSFWREIRASDDDWNSLDPGIAGSMLVQMHLIRAFEEKRRAEHPYYFA